MRTELTTTTIKETFHSLLKYFIKESKIYNIKYWVNVLRVSQPAISQWMNKKSVPLPKQLDGIIRVLFSSSDEGEKFEKKKEEFIGLMDKKLCEKERKKFKGSPTIGDYYLKIHLEKFYYLFAKLPFTVKTEFVFMLNETLSSFIFNLKNKDISEDVIFNRIKMSKMELLGDPIKFLEEKGVKDGIMEIDTLIEDCRYNNRRIIIQKEFKKYEDKLTPLELLGLANHLNWPNWVVTSFPKLYYFFDNNTILVWRKIYDNFPQEEFKVKLVEERFKGEIVIIKVGSKKNWNQAKNICEELDNFRCTIPFESTKNLHKAADEQIPIHMKNSLIIKEDKGVKDFYDQQTKLNHVSSL